MSDDLSRCAPGDNIFALEWVVDGRRARVDVLVFEFLGLGEGEVAVASQGRVRRMRLWSRDFFTTLGAADAERKRLEALVS